MELVLNKTSLLRTFSTDWKGKWAPAISNYCSRSKRKDIKEIIQSTNADINGDEGTLHLELMHMSTPIKL